VEAKHHRRRGAHHLLQLGIVMMLRHQLRDAVKYPGPRQHAKHGDQLAEVTGLANARRAKRDGQQLDDQQTGADFDQRGRRGPQ
jgi:hypothetical protein